ncbi:hypothetical protein GE09DRAFT_1178214 [Coniochaeta sp. 2T2.1]|nr:hypothetical protein GE09DRAFT_1178214 [Coniochaeta sp. 2T2.1]
MVRLGSIVCTALLTAAYASRTRCTCIPTDDCWPDENEWHKLNSTVGGRLIATVPAASVCHGEAYNESACDAVRQLWDFPQPHIFASGEIMSPYWQNGSCDPFSTGCSLGTYVSYSIAVEGPEDVRAGIDFSTRHNIRLVIKNTGHDYLGRSTGKGGLGLWMQSLKTAKVLPQYTSKHYSGAAMKLGAGSWAAQGGGHSLLSSTHGLSADNVLEWEVVTAGGKHLVATPTCHSDLYWALSGGGGGNYAVVLSVTIRAHPDGPVGGAFLTFNTSMGADKFWDCVWVFHSLLPSVVDAGATALYQIMGGTFTLLTMTAPGLTESEVISLLSPLTAALGSEVYTFVPTVSKTFYEHSAPSFGPLPFGPIPASDIVSSRLIPRSVVTKRGDELVRTLRDIVAQNFYVAGQALNVNREKHPPNAVLPAWRLTLLHSIVGTSWNWSVPREQMVAVNEKLMKQVMPALEALAPESGIYMNEGNADQVGWQREFFGENYERLLEVKRKYDPAGLFYAAVAVGSDAVSIDGDGRLCRHEEETGGCQKDEGKRAPEL